MPLPKPHYGPTKLVTHTREMDVETHVPVGNNLRKVYIQLPAFKKEAEQCETGFDKWIYILKNMEAIREIPFKEMNDAVFARLAEVSKVAALSEDERIRYDRDLKWARDYHAEMKYAKQVGIEEGIEKGIKEGRAEGRAEGRTEAFKEIVRKLKEQNMTIDQIMTLTSFSKEEIGNFLKD